MTIIPLIRVLCLLLQLEGFVSALAQWNWDPDNENIANIPRDLRWRDNIPDVERRGLLEIIRDTEDGDIRGLSVPGVHDTSSFVNMFLGIPYARPPVNEFRFKEPQAPQKWRGIDIKDCTYHRPACPQMLDLLEDDFANFTFTNEACLYLNIFQPNRTDHENIPNIYPVMIFIHGGGWKQGSALQHPGLVLAQRDMVVVTFNYRLGPLGFLTTGDSRIPGNMGLSDQEMAIRWVKKNIARFSGDPERITLVGHEAGAASVGIHMLSPLTRGLFTRAIMMSGSDLSPWAVIGKNQYPSEYATTLSDLVGCGREPGEAMIRCLRTKSATELVEAAEKVTLRAGETAGPFAPVVDFFDDEFGYLRDMPANLRDDSNNIEKVDLMVGFAKDDGAWVLAKNFSDVFDGIHAGVSKEEFSQVVGNVSLRRGARFPEQTDNAIEFLYTWWVDPDNSTARRKMLIDVFTDELYASGIDRVAKSHLKAVEGTGKTTFMYKYDYRSETEDDSTYWMGAYHGSDVRYLFGWPYLARNLTYQHLTGIRLEDNYSELDTNISNGTMQMWKDFAIHGNPTNFELNLAMPWNFYNLTWYPMKITNLTYFELDYNSTNEKEYHQPQLAFWQDYIYDILYLEHYTTTPYYSTPYPYQSYLAASYSLAAILIIVTILLAAFIITLSRARTFTTSGKRMRYY